MKDLYAYVNGPWLDSHVIPDDRGVDGTFHKLRDDAELDVRAIVEEDTGRAGALYGSFMDVEGVGAAGMAPLPAGPEGNAGPILGSGYGISATCEHPEEALKVLGSLLSKDAQDYIASSGRSYPARTESQPLYFESIDEEYREHVQTVFESAFASTVPLYMTQNWAKLESYIQPNLVSVYSGQTTMADMLESAQAQFGN